MFLGTPLYAAKGDITVGGDLLLRVRSSAGGFTVRERTDRIYERLMTVIGEPQVMPDEVIVKKASPDYAVFVRNRMIVTIDARTARANGTTPYKLGQVWLKSLRKQMPQY